MLTINNVFANLNNALIHNHNICYIKKTKVTKEIIKYLMHAGLIKEIQVKKKNYIILLIGIGVTAHKGCFCFIKNISRTAQRLFLTKYLLKSFSWQNRNKLHVILGANGKLFNSNGPENSLNDGGLLVATIKKG